MHLISIITHTHANTKIDRYMSRVGATPDKSIDYSGVWLSGEWEESGTERGMGRGAEREVERGGVEIVVILVLSPGIK